MWIPWLKHWDLYHLACPSDAYAGFLCCIVLDEVQLWVSVHGSESTKPHNGFSSHIHSKWKKDCLKIQISDPIGLCGSFLLLRKGPVHAQKKENEDMLSPATPVCACKRMFHMYAHEHGCQKTTPGLILQELPNYTFLFEAGISLAWNFTKRTRIGDRWASWLCQPPHHTLPLLRPQVHAVL